MKTLYEAVVTSSGGRQGHVRSQDGLIDFDVALPKEMGGKGGAPNPELLFAAGYSACFEGALLKVAREQKVSLTETSVTARVGIGPNEAGGFQLAVKLEIKASGVSHEELEKLVSQAHQICPYSNATRNNISVELSVSTNRSMG